MTRRPDLQNVVNDLSTYLDYQREEGITDAEVSREILARIKKTPLTPASPMAAETAEPVASPAPAETATRPAVTLEAVAQAAGACTRCPLHATRAHVVPGQGAQRPDIMFIGEAPGADEDARGLAFVGPAGQLLTKMIEAMGYTRDEVFIGNILKCRPPDNRAPLPGEIEACLPFLKQQLARLKPKVIVALGAGAAKALLETTASMTEWRGQWRTFEGTPLMPTFHPASLLHDASKKRDVWLDLQEVLRHLGRTPPPRKTAS